MTRQQAILWVNRLFLITSLLMFARHGFSEQSGTNRIVKQIDGIGALAAAIATTDGNYLAVTHAHVHKEAAEYCFFAGGCGPLTISKLNPSGAYLWKKSIEIDGDDYGTSSIRSIAEVNNGYVLVGQRIKGAGNNGKASGLVMKLDTTGNVLWKKSISGTYLFYSVIAHPDRTFTATGFKTIVKFNAAGQIIWQRHFKSESFGPRSLGTSDNGLILSAGKYDNSFFITVCIGADLWKMDLHGHMVWKRELQMDSDCFRSIHATSDNGFLLLGIYGTLIKLDENGEIQWQKAYYRPSRDYVEWVSVFQTADEGYAMAGTLFKQDGASNIVVLKLDKNQKIVFQKKLSFASPLVSAATIFSAPGDGYFIFGLDQLDSLLLLNIDSQGAVAGCNASEPITLRRGTPLGVKIITRRVRKPDSVSLNPQSMGLTEVATDASSKTICK